MTPYPDAEPTAVGGETTDAYRAFDRLIPGACFGQFQLPPDIAMVIERGFGAHVWDTTGREYVDYMLGAGPLILGHAHPAVVRAVSEQAALGTTYYTLNEPALALAEMVTGAVPCAEAVKFAASGSEATFFALRLARAYTGRSKILRFAGAYHGNHDYAQCGGVSSLGGENVLRPTSSGIPPSVSHDVLVGEFNALESVEESFEKYGESIAAIIVEPVQRALIPKPGFLQGLRKLCDQSGALLVFDEVVTGFRLNFGGAQVAFGVVPDLCALGKILGGGLSLGAVVGRRSIIELSVPSRSTWSHSSRTPVVVTGTLNGNPLSAAAGLTTLSILSGAGTYEALEAYGVKLANGLKAVAAELAVPLQILGTPTIIDVVFSDAPVETHEELLRSRRGATRAFKLELVREGVLVNPDARFYVSVMHTDSDLNRTLEAAYHALRRVDIAADRAA